MTDLEIYRLLRRQFRGIDEHLDQLALNCKTFAQARQLADEWAQAQKNYIEARNRIFESDSEKVTALYEQLGAAQDDIEHSLTDLKNIEKVLDKIGDAVRVGTSLVALGSL